MEENPLRILLINDNEDDYIAIHDLIHEIEGFNVELDRITIYETAVETINRQQHDVFLVDYLLNERNGLNLVRQAIEQGCTAPLILLTRIEDKNIGVEAIRAGASDSLIFEQIDAFMLERSIVYALERSQKLVTFRENELKLRKQTAELEMVTQVDAAVSKILDSRELLQQVVDLTKDGFDLNYVHVGLLNESGDTIEMAASAGEMAQKIVDTAPSIPVDQKKSLVAKAVRTRQGAVVNNVHEEPDYFPHPLTPEIQSELVVPIIVGEIVLGGLVVQSSRLNYFDVEDMRIYTILATQVGVALENVRRFEKERQLTADAEAMSEVARVVNSILELDEVLDRALVDLEGIIPYDAAHIILIENKNARMVASRRFIDQEELMNKPVWLADLPLSAKTISQQRPLLVPDTHKDPLFKPAVRGSIHARCLILVPLIIRDEVIAVLTIISYTPQRFSSEDVDVAFRFSQQVVIALENARLYKQVQRYSVELEQRVAERTIELRATQKELDRQEKLAVLGQLAGGVAHELRNPLGVISNAIYYLQLAQSDADEITREYLEIISSRVKETEEIVSTLLDFSRLQLAQREEVTILRLVSGALERNPPPKAISVGIQVDDSISPVFVDVQHIEQVLINLIINACQAMPEGGGITISAQEEGNQIQLSVSDTGHGIPPETMEKIFEPLFTTKIKGIGLGLALSKNLVEVNGGSINVESEMGQGTTFFVTLPIRMDE